MLPGGPASYFSEVLPWQRARFGADNVRLVACGKELDYVPWFPADAVYPFADSGRGPKALAGFTIAVMRAILSFRPDVIHLHSSYSGMLRLPIALLPRSRRPAVVYCAHGWAFNIRTSGWKKKAYALVERALAPLCNRSIAISAFEGRSALAAGLPAKNLTVIENGIATAIPDATGPACGFDPDRLQLLFVGRLDRQKGLDILERAMDLCGDVPVQLHVIGAQIVSSDARAARQRGNVTYHGWMDRARVTGFIARADAVIMPSRWEGFGLVAIEAMRQGRPVIASRVDALPEVLGDAGILFEPEDPVDLADTIAGLDRAELRRLGARGQVRFAERFTSERMNQQIALCYEEILAARCAG